MLPLADAPTVIKAVAILFRPSISGETFPNLTENVSYTEFVLIIEQAENRKLFGV